MTREVYSRPESAGAGDTDTINEKLDALLEASDLHIFNPVEVAQIKTGIAFVEAFDGDPATLLRVARAYQAVEGWVTVTQKVGLVIAFVVVLWANWERIFDLIRGGKP